MKQFNENKPIGYYAFDFSFPMCIYDVEYGIDDYVIAKRQHRKEQFTKNKLYYNLNGDAFFVKFNRRYYLKDFLRA